MITLAFFTFCGIAFILFIYQKRKSYYPYAVKSNYKYPLNEKHRAELHQGCFILPKTSEKSTIFAKIHVKSNLLGYFKQPYIVISSGGQTQRQYVEHGARGIRYLNLSHFAGKSKTIEISGRFLNIKNQEISLSVYENPITENAKILIIAPHPDDAEIAAYGFYEAHAQNVFILTVSAGERGKFKYRELYKSPKEQHLKKGDLRTWNSLTVSLLAGVPIENTLMLGYFNEMLDDMFYEKDKNFGSDKLNTDDVNTFRKWNFSALKDQLKEGANWYAFVENLKMVINEFKPDVIVTPHPYIDSHEDHKFSTIATIEALQELNLKNGNLLLYTNHYTDFEYYPIGKQGSLMPLPPKFDTSIYFDSIYSFPLDEKQQINKILAFDAMNDLRPNTEYRFWYRLFADGFTRGRERLFSIEKDYFNRYVRSNELFFVIPFGKIYDENTLNAILHGKR